MPLKIINLSVIYPFPFFYFQMLSLCLKWVSCGQCMVEPCVCSPCWSLSFSGIFRLLTFTVTTDRLGLRSTILLFIFCLFPLFLISLVHLSCLPVVIWIFLRLLSFICAIFSISLYYFLNCIYIVFFSFSDCLRFYNTCT